MSNIDIKLEEAQLLSEQKARMEMIISGKEKTYSEKVKYAKNKIREFYNYCKLNNLPKPVVSFSGGRDSSVLLYLVREMYPDTTAITATELFNPDNSKLIQKTSNICVFPPKMSFEQVIKEKGFPMISKELSQKINAVRNCKTNGKWIKTCLGIGKGRTISKKYLHLLDKTFVKYEVSHVCCNMLKGPVKHDKRPKFVGTTIFESQLRRTNWIKKGCNVYNVKIPQSRPLSIWNQNDIEKFIKNHKQISISDAYKKGWKRTGCMFCGFGLNIECMIRDRLENENIYRPTRLDLVHKFYPSAYNKYIWELGLYKPLADTYVTVKEDKKYMEYYRERERERESWYSSANFKNNLKKIISQIEENTHTPFSQKDVEAILSLYGSEK